MGYCVSGFGLSYYCDDFNNPQNPGPYFGGYFSHNLHFPGIGCLASSGFEVAWYPLGSRITVIILIHMTLVYGISHILEGRISEYTHILLFPHLRLLGRGFLHMLWIIRPVILVNVLLKRALVLCDYRHNVTEGRLYLYANDFTVVGDVRSGVFTCREGQRSQDYPHWGSRLYQTYPIYHNHPILYQ